MNAVIARIFGFASGAAAVFCCALAEQTQIAVATRENEMSLEILAPM
jgi:hypothetical protein